MARGRAPPPPPPQKKGLGSDKIWSVNNLSVPNFIRAELKFLPVLGNAIYLMFQLLETKREWALSRGKTM